MESKCGQFDIAEKLVPPEGDQNSKRLIGPLSNYEVYQFFKEVKEGNVRGPKNANKWKFNTHLNTVTYEVLQYLQRTPCIVQSPEIIEEFLTKLHPYNLTKAERLTILNTRPSQPVDIQAIVEESEERLTESQIEEILDIVDSTLPPLNANEEAKTDGPQE
ncbi:DNA-directed RNA polymerase III subunit RPC9 [Orchesella cincta]|uniref:DNA-directed RNA polymerase III subunit RPC9 n=1 Tax=Orchesella cincta TaxID=48709 RepID=A0A1D2NMW9_ORCCI|nr:DNA-directed RNA polymerase III subunit RPC9 [Orchesella cincta]